MTKKTVLKPLATLKPASARKPVKVLAALLLTVGGSLAFTSFSAKAQQSTRTVFVLRKT